MKKIIIALFLTFWIVFTSQSYADTINQNALEKELVVTRYEVWVFYGNDIHTKIDKIFINALLKKDRETLQKLYSLTAKYMENKNQDYLSKKDILVKYLLVRSYYELHYRMK